MQALQANPRCAQVVGLHRQSAAAPELRAMRPASARLLNSCTPRADSTLVVNAASVLHTADFMPERKLGDLSYAQLEATFRVNTFGPALVLRRFSALLDRQRGVLAVISAKVGSIADFSRCRLGSAHAVPLQFITRLGLPRRQVTAPRRTTCGPCCSHACSRPCPWSARTAVPTCASSPSSPRPPRCGGFSRLSASRPSRPASPQPAGRPPGTIHRSISDRTGRPWRNRPPSMSSTRKCSGSLLPSSPPTSDAPLPAPRPRQTTPHAHSAPSEMATSPPSLPVGALAGLATPLPAMLR